MISSKFILDILDLLLDGDEAGKALRPQISYLTDTEYEYTGCGVFASFKTDVQIESYRYHEDKIILDGVFINSSELSLGASATVFISNGVIDFLEIWSRDVDYPTRELTDYALKQQGTFGSDREIKSSRHGAKPGEIN